MTSMKIVRLSRPFTPHLRPKYFLPLDLGSPISNEPAPPLQMITNQLKENMTQGRLLYVINKVTT